MAKLTRSQINREIGKLEREDRIELMNVILGQKSSDDLSPKLRELAKAVIGEQGQKNHWMPDELNHKTWNL